jgi:hypothetical protein
MFPQRVATLCPASSARPTIGHPRASLEAEAAGSGGLVSKRASQLWLSCFLLTGTLLAAGDPFVGKWKLDPSRSKLTDEMKVESLGGSKYIFDFGGDNPEAIVVDGTDQPATFGTTMAVTAEAPDTWRVVRKKDGRIQIVGIWKLSADGTKLTDNFTGYRADGTTSNLLYVYTRAAGKAGFAGTWDSVSEQVNSVYEMQIQPYENAGLTLMMPAQQSTRSLKFDGRDYPETGPNIPAGMTCSGQRVSDHRLQLTDKINGKLLYTQQVDVSTDLKTLTVTMHIPGRTTPNILVFDRE